jgi:Protein of unknown function (DUF1156)
VKAGFLLVRQQNAVRGLKEVDFAIAVVSRHLACEKSIRHVHPSTPPLWWARRPLALMANEKRTAEDRRDCYWLYAVTGCKSRTGPKLIPVRDPAQFQWDEIRKIDHYALAVKDPVR